MKVLRRYLIHVCVLTGLLLAFGSHSFAQDEMTPEEKAQLDRVGRYKIINFTLFALLLGYAIARYSPRFFNARSADIQKAIKDATGLKLEADYRYSELDRRMANLAEEVKHLRVQAAQDMEREHARIRRQTREEIDHIHGQMLTEIDALRKEAAASVRRHTAGLAIDLAERRLADRFASGEPPELLHNFIHLVEQGNA